MPFGVNSDPSFRARKQRIRVRGCVCFVPPGQFFFVVTWTNWKNRKTVQRNIFCPIWQLMGFWQDGSERKHILRRNRLQVCYVLSHRIHESLIFMFFDINGRSRLVDVPKEIIRRRLLEGVWRTRYLLGVAHTIFVGSGAHDIFWEWRTRYFLSGAQDFL